MRQQHRTKIRDGYGKYEAKTPRMRLGAALMCGGLWDGGCAVEAAKIGAGRKN
jgi:hypothetical protein